MRYMLLIYENEAQTLPEAEQKAVFEEFYRFTEEVREKGVLEGGDPLMQTETASTVRVRDGEALTTDGPFAETTEALGGYYILDCATLDEALGYAAKIPSARWGSVEVRPIMEIGG